MNPPFSSILFLLTLMVLLLAGCSVSSQRTSEPVDRTSVLDSIRGQEIRAHMEVLAADSLQGREAGTEDYLRAADYVIAQYQLAGLKPLGDNGSYLQHIDFMESRLLPETARFSLQKEGRQLPLEFRNDFIRSGGFGEVEEAISAELVFVGHGIVAPELGHDDYANVDVKGKILVVLSGAPPGFDTDRRAFYSSGRGKAATALERGAVGVIGVRTPVDQKRRPWQRYLPGIGSPELRWLDANNKPHEAFAELKGSATLSESGAQKLFDLSGHDLGVLYEKHKSGATGSFALGVTATLARTSRQREVRSANVVGVLEGSDPELVQEFLVYTGHLDHIGPRPGKNGDDIHNGAYDNAAGVGSILEIAQAMSLLPVAPRRSVIFAMVTGEEKGLRGSSYFTEYPPVPIEQLVANINIDMPYLGFPVNEIHVFGAEHSTLLAPARKATAELGMALTPDPLPEEVRFIRSDQFSFVLKGIPAVAFKAGSQSSDPAVDGAAALDDFLKNHYHQASDDLNLPFSPEGAERFARAGLLMGLYVAEAEDRPRWLVNDFFGDKFSGL